MKHVLDILCILSFSSLFLVLDVLPLVSIFMQLQKHNSYISTCICSRSYYSPKPFGSVGHQFSFASMFILLFIPFLPYGIGITCSNVKVVVLRIWENDLCVHSLVSSVYLVILSSMSYIYIVPSDVDADFDAYLVFCSISTLPCTLQRAKAIYT